jgi:hypothetical protein
MDYYKKQQLRELAILNGTLREESPSPHLSPSVSPFNSTGMKRAKTGRWSGSVSERKKNWSRFDVWWEAAAVLLEMIGVAYAGIISAGLCLSWSARFTNRMKDGPWVNYDGLGGVDVWHCSYYLFFVQSDLWETLTLIIVLGKLTRPVCQAGIRPSVWQ